MDVPHGTFSDCRCLSGSFCRHPFLPLSADPVQLCSQILMRCSGFGELPFQLRDPRGFGFKDRCPRFLFPDLTGRPVGTEPVDLSLYQADRPVIVGKITFPGCQVADLRLDHCRGFCHVVLL